MATSSTKLFSRLLLLVVFVPNVHVAVSQSAGTVLPSRSEYVQEQWTVRDGLPVNNLNDIVQTHDGYIWLATWDGLVRFDGARFTILNVANTEGLPSSRVIRLFESRDSTLWIATVAPASAVRFREGRVVGSPGPLSSHATRITESSDGVWITTNEGEVFHYDPRELESFVRYPRGDPRAAALPNVRISSPEAGAWAARADALYKGDRVVFRAPSTIAGYIHDHEGSIWIATYTSGLFRIRQAPIRTFGVEEGMGGRMTAVLEDRSGALWFTGLTSRHDFPPLLVRLEDSLVTRFQNVTYSVWISEDREGEIWLATVDGPRRVNQATGRLERSEMRFDVSPSEHVQQRR